MKTHSQLPRQMILLGEIHASADYRRSLALVFVKRILMAAAACAEKYQANEVVRPFMKRDKASGLFIEAGVFLAPQN